MITFCSTNSIQESKTKVQAQETRKLDVRWGPTPDALMDQMFLFADLKEGDVLYDLGCGDGRVVISAAKKFNIRGVGVDLDPKRIEQSILNAEKAGVANLVKFRNEDLFDTEIQSATVFALYLNKKVNRKLRTRLFLEMPPGTRIVSHNWDMGEWKPDAVKQFENRIVYFWKIPANFRGTWTWKEGNSLAGEYKTAIKQSFQKISGMIAYKQNLLFIEDTKIDGASISFKTIQTDGEYIYSKSYSGKIMDNEIIGEINVQSSDGRKYTLNWESNRLEDKVDPLDEPFDRHKPL